MGGRRGGGRRGPSHGSDMYDNVPATSWYPSTASKSAAAEFGRGANVEGHVAGISMNGAFVNIGADRDAFLPWRSTTLGKRDIHVGDTIRNLVVEEMDERRGRYTLRGPYEFGAEGDIWGNWGSSSPFPSAAGTLAEAPSWHEWSSNAETWDAGAGRAANGSAGGDMWWRQGWNDTAQAWATSGNEDAWWWSEDCAGQSAQANSNSQHADASAPTAWDADEAAAHAPSGVPNRSALQAKLFACLSRGSTCAGLLGNAELRRFAEYTGFEGDDEEWATEYAALCKECSCELSVGLDEASWKRLVDDDSDNGCYCTDEELASMLQTFEQASDATVVNADAGPPCRGSPPELQQVASIEAPASERSGPQTRKQLKAAIFAQLDMWGSNTGRLRSAELRPFAERTGFDGNDEDWAIEYAILCKESSCEPSEGLDEASWNRLVDDDSDSGCYCNDDELANILQAFEREDVVPRAQAALPARSSAPELQQTVAVKPTASERAGPQTRTQLKASIFEFLNAQGFGSGRLRSAELRRFAEQTGFDGDDGEWSSEYTLLCKQASCEPSVGLDEASWSQLVDDDSDDGCYCSDEELASMLRIFQDASSGELPGAPAVSPPVEILQQSPELVPEKAVLVSGRASHTRAELKVAIFHCLTQGSGMRRLRSAELRRFAEQTGFDGDDGEWVSEYKLLCREASCEPSMGLDEEAWSRLVDDDSDSGCYCSDEELASMLVTFEQAAKAAAPWSQVVPASGASLPAVQQAAAPEPAAPVETSRLTRAEVKAAIFASLNAKGGRLRSAELRRFAEQTGFDGGDEDWNAEYKLLCKEASCVPSMGLDEASWSKLVDDDSDNGRYCSDEELASMMELFRSSSKDIPAPLPLTRAELKVAAFRAFDVDGDGHLSCKESLAFARHVGFEGPESDWETEFKLLCHDNGCDPSVGIDASTFGTMIDDDSDSGCFADDEQLAAMLASAKEAPDARPAPHTGRGETSSDAARPAPPAIPPAAAPAPTPAPTLLPVTPQPTATAAASTPALGREELKVAVFKGLDTDGDGQLRLQELLPFVRHTGFEGTEAEWAQEYVLLCKDIGCHSAVGISMESFDAMVEDQSDSGCYCTDEELCTLLEQLQGSGTQGEAKLNENAEADPWEVGRDPWAASAEKGKGKSDGSKGSKGTGKDKGRDKGNDRGKGKSKGKAENSGGTTAEPNGHDPWAVSVDPWATPGAQSMNEQRKRAAAEEAQKTEVVWNQYAEVAARPAMNAQALLEASRTAMAARKEQAEESNAKPVDHSEGDANIWTDEARVLLEEDATCIARPVSMPAAVAMIGASVARLVAGDRKASEDLLAAVVGAPSRVHALAIVGSAARSFMQGRRDDARKLLALDELPVDEKDGEAALLEAFSRLSKRVGVQGAPLLLRALLGVLTKVDDKRQNVRSAAAAATEELVALTDPFAFEALLPALLAAMDAKRSPQLKLHALRLLSMCWRRDGETTVKESLPQLLPVVAVLLLDTSSEVRSAAKDAVDVLLALPGNRDLEPHLDEIRGCASGSKDVTKCVRDLAEVVFVQQVEAPALAMVMPILMKGLKSRNARTQRQACVIAENMCRLLPSAADVEQFGSQLLPLLSDISEGAADPDVRAVAGRARASLSRVTDANAAMVVRQEMRLMLADVASAVASRGAPGLDVVECPTPVRDVIFDHAVSICVGLSRCQVFGELKWWNHVAPHIEPLLGEAPTAEIIERLRSVGQRLAPIDGDEGGDVGAATAAADSDDGGENDVLCDCAFTLACGAATLLSGARLRLLKGGVYGLVGANDSGKSTLLRAIHDRRVEDFPEFVFTSLVEHGVGEKEPECGMTPAEYLLADPVIQSLGLTVPKIVSALRGLGFKEGGRLKQRLRELSGGWRMKLGLARAMLQAADVLLLDEPTGHLDAEHVTWLVSYIRDLREEKLRPVTTIVVSHDASFLDRVCSHVVHVCDHKLRTYRGNFSSFLQRVPDAQLGSPVPHSAQGAENEQVSAFVLPEPGMLEGVRTRTKRFLHLDDATYTYPGSTTGAAVRGATVECSLRSRVAIVGPNGAGKSTLAGLLVGELAPDLGSAWRHPNLRVAFVAQLAFHHLERHMDLTATQYILWRFEGNEDREAMEFRAEEEERAEPIAFRLSDSGRLVPCDLEDERALKPEVIVDRRQRGRLGYEYEMRWQGGGATTWVPIAQIAAMGCLGMAKRENERHAAQRALSGRPLTTPGVEAHLAGFGLDAEEATHRRLGALSNGQRARVVLGAATWLAPHLLVLDEPSNYLDRTALGALAVGLQAFAGGVVVISHNAALLAEVCDERWSVHDGVVQREGGLTPAAEQDLAAADAARAASAAKVAAKAAAAHEKERKKQRRLKEIRRKKGEQVSDDEEEWWEDLLRKTNSKAMGS